MYRHHYTRILGVGHYSGLTKTLLSLSLATDLKYTVGGAPFSPLDVHLLTQHLPVLSSTSQREHWDMLGDVPTHKLCF